MNFPISFQPAVPAHEPIPNFDRLAHLYRWMEYSTFGPWLARCRFHFLRELAGYRRGLVFGDGDGRFTARLLAANPGINIEAIDSSEAMLFTLLQRAGHSAERVRAHCMDARAWEPHNGTYDLVVTHFFLDCLGTVEVEALARRVRTVAVPSARWVVSEFAIPEGWFGKLVARPSIWILYRAFGFLTGLGVSRLPDHHAALREAGFILEERLSWLNGLLTSEIWRVAPDLLESSSMLQVC
jgi:hypothetical protein